jgi:hypothetical protein
LPKTFSAAAAALVAVGLWAGGCGGAGSEKSVPSKEARLAVASFLKAVQKRRFSEACGLVTTQAQGDLRALVFEAFRVTDGPLAARERQVAETHERARTCPGVLALLASELGAEMTDLERGVALAHISFLFKRREFVVLDDEAWVVLRGDDGWKIDTTNAISDALP